MSFSAAPSDHQQGTSSDDGKSVGRKITMSQQNVSFGESPKSFPRSQDIPDLPSPDTRRFSTTQDSETAAQAFDSQISGLGGFLDRLSPSQEKLASQCSNFSTSDTQQFPGITAENLNPRQIETIVDSREDDSHDVSQPQTKRDHTYTSDSQLPDTQRNDSQLPGSQRHFASFGVSILCAHNSDSQLPDTQRDLASFTESTIVTRGLGTELSDLQQSFHIAKESTSGSDVSRSVIATETSTQDSQEVTAEILDTQEEVSDPAESVQHQQDFDDQENSPHQNAQNLQRAVVELSDSQESTHAYKKSSQDLHRDVIDLTKSQESVKEKEISQVDLNSDPNTPQNYRNFGGWMNDLPTTTAIPEASRGQKFSLSDTKKDFEYTRNLLRLENDYVSPDLPFQPLYPIQQATHIKEKSIINSSTSGNSSNANPQSSSLLQPNISKEPVNKFSVRRRKELVVSACRNPKLTTAMRLWHKTTMALLDPFRDDDECWLHPCPPRPYLSLNGILRPRGTLQKTFIWTDHLGRHFLKLNFGIVTKLIYHELTKKQEYGLVNKQWHLSHLCGNWVCINPKHTTVEPGAVNISRNNCFSHRSGCLHDPPCMKERKVALGADGKLVDHEQQIPGKHEAVVVEWDDWSVRDMDVDVEESESMMLDEDDDGGFLSMGA